MTNQCLPFFLLGVWARALAAADFSLLVGFRLRNTLPAALAASSVVTSGLWYEEQRDTKPWDKAARSRHVAPPPRGC
jgi:hypothetical protein